MYRSFGKRGLDLAASLVGLIILTPVLIIIALFVKLSSKGPVLYVQERLGRQFKPFNMIKFRSMVVNQSEQHSLVTAKSDERITAIGVVLRRYKLDELPQLINVLKGDMSLVGPRPEVSRYANHYLKDYEVILSILPGITDNAAIEFKHEEVLLSKFDDKETAYIQSILPKKIKLYKKYIESVTLLNDLKLIFKTIF